MPYAPGNQNNAAEYIAQAGNDVAAGIRQFQQNDLMRSTDISKFYSTAQTDPALVQFLSDPTKAPPGVSKIYQKLNSTGHLSVAEAAQLGSFTDLYTKNKVQQQTQADNAAKMEMEKQRLALSTRTVAVDEARQAFEAGKPTKGMTFPNQAALEKEYPKNAYDYSMVKNPDGTVTVPTVSPRAPASSNVEQGFQLKADGTGIEPTPGGSAYLAIQAAEKKAQSAIDSRLAQGQTAITTIDRVLPKLTGGTTGLVGKLASKIPGWDAYNVEKQIETIKSNIGFEQLADMRANSPTGGALGQIAIKELDYLQAALGNLDIGQDADQLVQTMNDVRSHYQNYKDTIAAIRAGKTELPAKATKPLSPFISAPGSQGQGGGAVPGYSLPPDIQSIVDRNSPPSK